MAEEEYGADVFAVPDFWKSSQWMDPSLSTDRSKSPFFSLDLTAPESSATNQSIHVAPGPSEDSFFKVPAVLNELELENSNQLLDSESITGDSESFEFNHSDSQDDLWLFQDELLPQPAEYKSWVEFDHPTHKSQLPSFITEAGPSVFDSLLLEENPLKTSHQAQSSVVESAAYCACLLALAMGRESLLFTWDPRNKSFRRTHESIHISGFSLQSLGGVDRMCIACGNSMKFLRSFVARTFSGSSSSSRVALAGTMDKLLLAVQSEAGRRGCNARSVLQLQAIVHPVQYLLRYFEHLVQRLRHAKTDEQVLLTLFAEAQAVEHRGGLLRDAVREVLHMVSKPWTNFVEEWIGVKPESGIPFTKDEPGSRGFVQVARKAWIDDVGLEVEELDFFLNENNMPSFVPEETARSLFETGRNLRFLRSNHPEHVLCQPAIIHAASPPTIQWAYDWESIKRLEESVRNYEASLSKAISDHESAKGEIVGHPEPSEPTGYESDFFGKSAAEIEASVLASINRLDRPPTPKAPDHLAVLVGDGLFQARRAPDHEDVSPHWSLLPLLSFGPLISAQARLVNRECSKLLFTTHRLRDHLDLQRQFHLLGNGVFCSQLAHALFDPDLDTAERQAGIALSGGTMGLRLHGRKNWPPASSELRLALMGVLAESYQPRNRSPRDTDHPSSRSHKVHLPGDVSFAVRDLSPEEIERCMDLDSLYALDFLRLSYKAPAVLHSILTPITLAKYDRLFKSLLRVLRMLYVVKHMFRETMRDASKAEIPNSATLRFRIEAHHFVSQIAIYFFDSGITQPWSHFDAWLDRVEKDVCQGGVQDHGVKKLRVGILSPDQLREHHEHVLDNMMRNLLLRKRQAPVLELLEDIFNLVLIFAKTMRRDAAGKGTGSASEPEAPESLYVAFRKKVEVFIAVCRGLGEKNQESQRNIRSMEHRKEGLAHIDGGEDTIERLVFMLDLGGYYGKHVSG